MSKRKANVLDEIEKPKPIIAKKNIRQKIIKNSRPPRKEDNNTIGSAVVLNKNKIVEDKHSGERKQKPICGTYKGDLENVLEIICKKPDLTKLTTHYLKKPKIVRYEYGVNGSVPAIDDSNSHTQFFIPLRFYQNDLVLNIMKTGDQLKSRRKHFVYFMHAMRISVRRGKVTDDPIIMPGSNSEEVYNWYPMIGDCTMRFMINNNKTEEKINKENEWQRYEKVFKDPAWPAVSDLQWPYSITTESSVTIPCDGCEIDDYIICFKWYMNREFCIVNYDAEDLESYYQFDEGYFHYTVVLDYAAPLQSIRTIDAIQANDQKSAFNLANSKGVRDTSTGYPGMFGALVQQIKEYAYYDLNGNDFGQPPSVMETVEIKDQLEQQNSELSQLKGILSQLLDQNCLTDANGNKSSSLIMRYEDLKNKLTENNGLQQVNKNLEQINNNVEQVNNNNYVPPQARSSVLGKFSNVINNVFEE